MDFFLHCQCGPVVGWQWRPGSKQEANSRKQKGTSNSPMQLNTYQSTAIHCCWSSVHLCRQERFLCADFSKLPTKTGIPCGNVGSLTLCGLLCEEVLCWNEDFEKALAEMTHIQVVMKQVLYGLKCLSKASLGSTARAATLPGRLPRHMGPHARGQVWISRVHRRAQYGGSASASQCSSVSPTLGSTLLSRVESLTFLPTNCRCHDKHHLNTTWTWFSPNPTRHPLLSISSFHFPSWRHMDSTQTWSSRGAAWARQRSATLTLSRLSGRASVAIPGGGWYLQIFPSNWPYFFQGKHLIHFSVLKMKDFWTFNLHNCILVFDAVQVYLSLNLVTFKSPISRRKKIQ